MKKLYVLVALLGCFGLQLSWAQQKSISGTVFDETGGPLPGATIIVEGSSRGGVATDFDGNFSIEASAGESLLVTYVGYADQRITIGTADNYSITLTADNELEEVVLTALGLEKKKDDDLSSTSVVQVDQLQKSGESGVLQGLSGKTSGVNITRNSGDPGSGAYIQIRGQNTINGDNSPLIVLDGAIISNSNIGGNTAGVVQQSRLNDINPDDIESISVIKGASAAAIYGTGAANGVLVIKTKSGAKGGKGWSVNVKSQISIDEVNIEWEKQSVWGQGFDGIWFGDPGVGRFVENTGFSYGDKISLRAGGNDIYDFSGGWFETESGRRIGSITTKNDRTVYNQVNRDAVFGTGYTYENSVSFSHNTDKSSTYVSFANFDQSGVIQGNSDYRRTNVKLNNTSQATDKLTVKLSTSYTNIESNRIQTGSNLNGLYLGYLRTSPDYDIRDYKGTNHRISGGVTTVTPNSHRSYRRSTGSFRTFNTETGAFNYAAPTYNNPLWTINELKALNDVNRFIVAPEINFNLNPYLNFTARYSIDFYQDNRVDYWPAGSAGDGNNGLWDEDRISEQINQLNLFVTGETDITDDINLNYVVGYQTFENDYRRLSAQETSFTNPDQVFLNPGNTTGENSVPYSFTSLRRKSGAYAVLSFELYEDLLIEVTGRVETVSTLPNAGIIFYPSVSAGYKLTDVFDSDEINFFKLRASYGEVGIEADPYATSTVFEPGGIRASWGDGLDGALYGNPFRQDDQRGNPNLKEGRKSEWEIGFDGRFFNDKISLSATYYENKIVDGILSLPTVPSTGFGSELQNAATITNKGIEIDLTADIYRTEDFNFALNASFTQNKNLVEDLAGSAYFILNGFTSTSSGIAEGEPFAVMRTGAYERDAAGNFVLNVNGFPNAASERKVGAGDPNPDFRAGLGTSMNYKNFSFTTLFESSQGNDVWNGTKGVLHFFGIHKNTETVNNTGATIVNAAGTPIPNGATFRGHIDDFGGGPVAIDSEWWTTNGGGFGDVGEIFIEDGSWVKLREITLSYAFNQDILDRLSMSNLSLSVSGRNLFTWTDIDGFDPENNLTGASRGRGLEYFSNPGTRSVLATLKFGF